MAKPNRTNKEQGDRSDMRENQVDETAGEEFVQDDLAMEAGRQQGREPMDDASEFGGQGGQREGSPDPEGTGYTGNSGNMSGSERGRSERTANNIDDGSTTEDTDSENPAA